MICSYLSNQKQRIKANDVFSSYRDLIWLKDQSMHFFVSSFSSMVCYFFLEDTDICHFLVFLNRTPTSTQLYLPSTSFTHLRPAHFRLHPALCNTLKDQNIARNWAISCWASSPFLLKIGTHGILERLIPNTDLNFWNSNPKIHFWWNLSRKSQSCPFCLKIGTLDITRLVILIPTLVF